MSRPSLVAVDPTSSGWVSRLNANFAKLLDTPFPIYLAANSTALDVNNAGLYVNCLAVVETNHRIYRSNGTSWELYDKKLTHIANLNTGTATITDIKNAYNALLADMVAKGFMAA
jgi:hypothetical protein